MNQDAENWIANWIGHNTPPHRAEMLREAMRWAYADAAKVCADSAVNTAWHCAKAIEERAK